MKENKVYLFKKDDKCRAMWNKKKFNAGCKLLGIPSSTKDFIYDDIEDEYSKEYILKDGSKVEVSYRYISICSFLLSIFGESE